MNREELQNILDLVGYESAESDTVNDKILFLEKCRSSTLDRIHKLEKNIECIDYVLLSLAEENWR